MQHGGLAGFAVSAGWFPLPSAAGPCNPPQILGLLFGSELLRQQRAARSRGRGRAGESDQLAEARRCTRQERPTLCSTAANVFRLGADLHNAQRVRRSRSVCGETHPLLRRRPSTVWWRCASSRCKCRVACSQLANHGLRHGHNGSGTSARAESGSGRRTSAIQRPTLQGSKARGTMCSMAPALLSSTAWCCHRGP